MKGMRATWCSKSTIWLLVLFRISLCAHSAHRIERKLIKMNEDHESEVEILRKDLEKERRRTQDVDVKAALSFGKTVQEDQRLQMDQLKIELKLMSARVKKYEAENKMLKRDVGSACRTLHEARLEKTETMLEMESKQSTVTRKLHEQIQNMNSEAEEMKTKSADLEQETSQVRDRLRASEARNSWYERGNGLSDVVQHQKQLEADIRRRELDRSKLLVEIGQKEDKISLLVKTCEILKNSTPEGAPIPIDEDELRAMLRLEENSLCAQNREFNQQIDTLEDERNRLLKRLRNNAAVLYEDGLCIGLSSAQTEQVIEFAGNLKDGSIQLPMTDKSVKLGAELESLKIRRQSDLCTIDRLEREIEALKIMNGFDGKTMATELGILRTTLKDIQAQNNFLQEELKAMAKSKKEQCSSTTCTPTESKNLEISHSAREKLEKILGECLQATITPFQLSVFLQKHEKIEKELCAAREYQTSARAPNEVIMNDKRNLELEIQGTNHDLQLSKCRIAELESQLFERNKVELEKELECLTTTAKVSTRSAHVQVDADRAETRRTELELQGTKEALLASERKSSTYENRIKRLQETLKQQSLVHDDKKRIVMAHSALKSLLDEKNQLIAKYRRKDTENKQAEKSPNRPRCGHSCTVNSMEEMKPREEAVQVPVIYSLVTRLEEASDLVKEKDATIRSLKVELQDTQGRMKTSIMQHSKTCEALQHCKDEEERLSNIRVMLQESLDDKCVKSTCQVTDLKNQINLRDERIDCLSKSSQRVKGALRSKHEELIKLGAIEADLQRTKSALNAIRRRRANGEKALSTSQQKCADASEDNESLHKEVCDLQKQLTQARDEKRILENRYRRASAKIRELTTTVGSAYDESKIEGIEDDYKTVIRSLKTEISELRGIVAACKLKEEADEMHKAANLNRNRKSKSKSDVLQNISGSYNAFRTKASKGSKSNELTKQIQESRNGFEQTIKELAEELCSLKDIVNDKDENITKVERGNAVLLERISSMKASKDSEIGNDSSLLSREAVSDNHIQNYKQKLFKKEFTTHSDPYTYIKIDDLQKLYEGSQAELDRLKNIVEDLTSTGLSVQSSHIEDMAKLKMQITQFEKAQGSDKVEETTLKERVQNLEDENIRLRIELNSFDLEFFDQLEDLKYKYNEAKLKGYGVVC